MAEIKTPSLQRLLSLDKSFDGLNERIESAADIIRLPLDRTDQIVLGSGNYGRHEFVFRWIVEKLKNDAVARANPLAWALLRRLLTALPTLRIPKLLANAGVTAVVVSALADHFQNQANPAASADLDLSESTKTKKRKRPLAPEATVTTYAQQYEIFVELSKLLHTVDLPTTHHLTVDLTKFWFLALVSLSQHTTDQTKPHNEQLFTSEIQFITKLWTTTTRTVMKPEVESSFSQDVAWPVLLLAAQLDQLGLSQPEAFARDFIRKELLIASHDMFLKSLLSGTSKAKVQQEVQKRCAPITTHLSTYLKSSDRNLQRKRESLVSRLLSLFFEDCYKLKNHHTPRERRAHGKWIEALFLHISSIVDQIYPNTTTVESKRHLVMSMLNNVETGGDALTGLVLEKVVLDFGNLATELSIAENRRPDFGVIARVMVLDPAIFHEGQQNPTLTLQCLLNNISLHSSRADVSAQSTEVEEWVNRIALPLITAQAQPQRAERFFEVWTTTLEVYDLKSSGPWCLWQHPKVRDALASLVEKSLDIVTTRRILNRTIALFKSDAAHTSKVSEKQTSAISTSSLALAIILDVIRSDEAVDELRTTYQEVIQLTINSLSALRKNRVSRTHFWQLLVRLNQLIVSDYDSVADADFVAQSLRDQVHCFEDAVQSLLKLAAEQSLDVCSIAAALNYTSQMVFCCADHGINLEKVSSAVSKIFSLSEDERKQLAPCKDLSLIGHNSVVAQYPQQVACAFARYPSMHNAGESQQENFIAGTDLLRLLQRQPMDDWSESLFLRIFKLLSGRNTPSDSNERQEITEVVEWEYLDSSFMLRLLAEQGRNQILCLISRYKTFSEVLGSFLQGWKSEENDSIARLNNMLGFCIRFASLSQFDKATREERMKAFSNIHNLGKIIDKQAARQTTEAVMLFEDLCPVVLAKIDLTADECSNADGMIAIVNKYLRKYTLKSSQPAQSSLARCCLVWLDSKNLSHLIDREVIKTAAEEIARISHNPIKADDDSLRLCVQALSLPESYWQATGSEIVSAIEEAKGHCTRAASSSDDLARIFTGSTLFPDGVWQGALHKALGSLKADTEGEDVHAERRWPVVLAREMLLGKDLGPHLHHKRERQLSQTISSEWSTLSISRLACMLLEPGSPGIRIDNLAFAGLLIQALPATIPQPLFECSAARGIVPVIRTAIETCTEAREFNAAMQSIAIIVKNKRWLVNQINLEGLLSTMHKLCSPSSRIRDTTKCRFFFNDICNVLRLILQFHRPSLGGRLHIVIPVLRQLMACLFIPGRGSSSHKAQFQRNFQHPPWLDQDTKSLLPTHAQLFTRLIALLCNPPQSTVPGYRAGSDQPRLTDVVREARLHVSEFVPALIHAFCHFQLHGILGEGMKEVLAPAIHAMFDVMDMAEPEDKRVIALGASMNKAELALLRKEHGEWKRFGRWRGA
ncbi:hypothetical protein K461DRAFT_275841 [Myriangium duriaei CBS 260.36]|uniref:Nucleolar 27S pre-rRNA processing Urb2/Npa2 C-terminal domain-containing protein n=1 Tax=Myriangium duriaei CBS 260.36 TaxID=1168546 RepID=A0A9P4J5X0_9PEZI|nr:hypothetical protein K461DRAFT_275841 [Myriangium duriaei CBS 260.36]